ncbi:electron transport complex subunit RsxC [Vallitalea guaymasensis]|uniref:electron transport complex subunit RsxC n=1 Tax=Vallitalea guaymasensis TaxID=1185412 RepID=UPI0023533ED8|nr:electron transport complex subunit RsxC [Vallitalea guaymasensis]
MGALTFKRGIHPSHSKDSTEKKPIKIYMPKGDLVFPMLQHIGAPCKPLVKKGDKVLMGQKIGEPQGFVSSPIHATVSGTVKAIKDVLHPNGSKVQAIVIENDGEYTEIETMKERKDYKNLSREEIINIIKEAGIVGMGGATFPTFIKLSPPPEKKIDHIIVNGAECEPYLTSDHRIMIEETQRVVKGLEIILHLFPNAKGVIGIEDNKPDAIKAMKEAVKGISNITVATLKTKYPQGAEKQLIYSITKREVPAGGLPADVGCIVQNIDTVVAIHRAVLRGRPLMRRIVTVSGGAIKEPQNFKVRIGTSYRELIEAAGGFTEEPAKVISGGPMMGLALFSLDVPVIKGSSSILCLTKKEAAVNEESNCIRCGKCVSICPMNLLPLELNKFAINNEDDLFVKYKGMNCIECGACSYICPSNRHLTHSIRTTKRTIMAKKKK